MAGNKEVTDLPAIVGTPLGATMYAVGTDDSDRKLSVGGAEGLAFLDASGELVTTLLPTPLPVANIPGLPAGQIVSDTFHVDRIPALAASKITSGVLATARLASGTAAAGKYPDGSGVWTTLPAGSTNLAITGTTGARTITSDTGTDAVIPLATASVSGLVGTTDQTFGGTKTAVNWVSTSDRDLKTRIKAKKAYDRLPDMLRFVEFMWIDTEEMDVGVIAQEVAVVAPEYVYTNEEGKLAVDKASLALECVIGLASRVRELEERLSGIAIVG